MWISLAYGALRFFADLEAAWGFFGLFGSLFLRGFFGLALASLFLCFGMVAFCRRERRVREERLLVLIV